MTRWVLADYGEVISDPMPAETILELADLAGMQADEFRDRYWKFRPPYDLGQSDRAYWSAVLGHELQAEPQLVEAMVRVDVAGWMTLNPRTLAAAGRHAARRDRAQRVPGPGRAGAPGGFGGGHGSSAIASWVTAHFTKETVGGQTVYDLTQPLSAS
jgi:hypothetical protein